MMNEGGISGSCILKGALEKGSKTIRTSLTGGSSSGNLGSVPVPIMPQVHSHSHHPLSPCSSPIPYSTEELRGKLLEKYFSRTAGELQLHNEGQYFLPIHDEEKVKEAFAHFVVNVPILLDGHMVGRKAWAKAFYETDVIDSAKCLFEAMFTEQEMRDCTLNGKNHTQELSAVKMLAILRASCWMKNKEQDPYSFNPDIPQHNVYPSKEDQDKIEKKVFTERRSQANRKNKKRQHNVSISSMDNQQGGSVNAILEGDSHSRDSSSTRSEGSHEGDNNSSPKSPSSSLTSSPGKVEPQAQTYEFGELEELFYRFPEEFLDTLFLNWQAKFIFIDGILVEKEKWKKAFDEGSDTVKAAWTLFLATFSNEEIMKCTLNGKNGTTELCPVKKLAIIRAVEWMRQKYNYPDLAEYWDNDDDECNVFPSKQDKERIETKVFTEKRYQQSRQLTMTNKNGIQ